MAPGSVTPLHPLEGHEAARGAIARAFQTDRLPPALLLHGPSGVGKQRLALWMGQLLLCAAPSPEGPCGGCRDCRMALGLQHPDLHWYFPLKRPPAKGSKERDQEALDEARQELLSQFREAPLRPSHSEEVRGIHLGTILNLRREASRRPALAPRRLFIVAEAEELVSQESAPEAANALLKTLEEPPPDSWIVLTASEAGRLLPTIRSRTTSLYLPPLPRARVRAFLERERGGPSPEIEQAVTLSGGSIGQALGFLPEGGEEGPLERTRREAFRLLRAALTPGRSERFARALSVKSFGARGIQSLLVALEGAIRDLAALAASPEAEILSEDLRGWLEKSVRDHGIHPERAARSVGRIEAARALAAGNVNPQLLLSRLLLELHDDLVGEPAALATHESAEFP